MPRALPSFSNLASNASVMALLAALAGAGLDAGLAAAATGLLAFFAAAGAGLASGFLAAGLATTAGAFATGLLAADFCLAGTGLGAGLAAAFLVAGAGFFAGFLLGIGFDGLAFLVAGATDERDDLEADADFARGFADFGGVFFAEALGAGFFATALAAGAFFAAGFALLAGDFLTGFLLAIMHCPHARCQSGQRFRTVFK